MCPGLFLDRKISLISGCAGENDGGPNSAEDGFPVILVLFILIMIMIMILHL